MIDFGAIPADLSDMNTARVVVLPVPFDGTSTWIKGADKGPEALLDASTNMELFDIETRTEPYRIGIHTAPPVDERKDVEKMLADAEKAVASYLEKGKFVVTIGGEHSISYAPIKAHADRFENLTVLQLDAHTDLRDEYEGSPYNHACVLARAKEHCPIVQVGIRSMDYGEMKHVDPSRVFWAHEIVGETSWEQKAIDQLTENVYITIDLDAFDPSILPSTGTPEPGGLLWYPTLRFLRRVMECRNVVGFDIVELCPNPQEKASDFLAAKLLYKLLAYRFFHQLERLP